MIVMQKTTSRSEQFHSFTVSQFSLITIPADTLHGNTHSRGPPTQVFSLTVLCLISPFLRTVWASADGQSDILLTRLLSLCCICLRAGETFHIAAHFDLSRGLIRTTQNISLRLQCCTLMERSAEEMESLTYALAN